MSRTQADQLSGQRNLILGLLVGAAAAAWALLAWQGAGEAHMAMASPTMGMRAPMFLTIWVLMMVAMMFPTAAPMVCKNRYSIFRTVSDQSATTALASLARPGALPSSPAPCGAPLRGSGAGRTGTASRTGASRFV
jgi:predicted metal-binding membrane protein